MSDDATDKHIPGEITTTKSKQPFDDVYLDLPPSDIRYMPSEGGDQPDNINDTLQTMDIYVDNSYLKVVKKGGVYFSVDTARLAVMKRLHGEGRCPSVKVVQVPLDTISPRVQDVMTHLLASPARQKGRRHGKGPLKLLNLLHRERGESPMRIHAGLDVPETGFSEDGRPETGYSEAGSESDGCEDSRNSSGVVSTDDDTEEENEAVI